MAESRGEHHRHDFDRDRQPIFFVPDWGYYGSPYWYDSSYPDYGTATGGIGYSPTDGGVAANPPLANGNGAPAFGQQPANAPLPPAATPELTRAEAELTQAQEDLNAAKQRVRDSLAARPDYRAALAQKAAAEDRVDTLHARGVSDYDQLLPAAQAALEARQQVSQIETSVMANDPQITEARTRLEAAVTTRSALQARAG
jgi:hypothetical protein